MQKDTASVAFAAVNIALLDAVEDEEGKVLAAAILFSFVHGSKALDKRDFQSLENILSLGENILRGEITQLTTEDLECFEAREAEMDSLFVKAPVTCPECCRKYLCLSSAAEVGDPNRKAYLILSLAHAGNRDLRQEIKAAVSADPISEDWIVRLIELALSDGESK